MPRTLGALTVLTVPDVSSRPPGCQKSTVRVPWLCALNVWPVRLRLSKEKEEKMIKDMQDWILVSS